VTEGGKPIEEDSIGKFQGDGGYWTGEQQCEMSLLQLNLRESCSAKSRHEGYIPQKCGNNVPGTKLDNRLILARWILGIHGGK